MDMMMMMIFMKTIILSIYFNMAVRTAQKIFLTNLLPTCITCTNTIMLCNTMSKCLTKFSSLYFLSRIHLNNIYYRIFNDCEVRIENSVTRITVRHRKACRVMLNSYPE